MGTKTNHLYYNHLLDANNSTCRSYNQKKATPKGYGTWICLRWLEKAPKIFSQTVVQCWFGMVESKHHRKTNPRLQAGWNNSTEIGVKKAQRRSDLFSAIYRGWNPTPFIGVTTPVISGVISPVNGLVMNGFAWGFEKKYWNTGDTFIGVKKP